jgi:hypothetical protein
MKCIHSNPPIFEIEDFLSDKTCDEFIERIEKDDLIIPSQVNLYKNVCLCIYVYICICVYIYVFSYIDIHICVCVYVYRRN